MTLVIMAAGIGSRFGGLKQLESVDDDGNFLLDYSIYDAISAGFSKVIFIIKQDCLPVWKRVFYRLSKFIEVDYVFQSNDLSKYTNKKFYRDKPFGTAHALLSVKEKIVSSFTLINADDFYGKNSFRVAFEFLRNNNNQNAVICFPAKNTLSNFGKVKRGVCETKNGILKNITECEMEKTSSKTIKVKRLDTLHTEIFDLNLLSVSMNLFVLSPSIMNYLENDFKEFLNDNKDNLDTCEFMLPSFFKKQINENGLKINVLYSSSVWKGLTYKDDLVEVKKYIKLQKKQNNYPNNLWL